MLYKGEMKNFMQGYDEILKWIEGNGYCTTGPFREVYHDFSHMDSVAIEIQFPVEKV